jgi:hypothetical protein
MTWHLLKPRKNSRTLYWTAERTSDVRMTAILALILRTNRKKKERGVASDMKIGPVCSKIINGCQVQTTHHRSSSCDIRTQTRRGTAANGSLRCEITVLTDDVNLLNTWLSALYRLNANARSCYVRWIPHRITCISCKATSQSLVADGWDIFTPTVKDGCCLECPRFASLGPVVIRMNLLKKTWIFQTALTDTIDTHTKGQDMQPNTDGAHRNRPTLKQNL